MNDNTAAVILAAGDGKRMNSAHSKVCCRVLQKPMLSWVLDACAAFGLANDRVCAVVSGQNDGAAALLPPDMPTAVQSERLGTGHAVRMAIPFLENMKSKGVQDVCVLYGDVPFLRAETLSDALCEHRHANNAVTVMTAVLPDGARYGRIVHEGDSIRIVEAADATAEQLAIREINSGIYWFSLDFLLSALPRLQNKNAQHEYYLTDLIGMAGDFGLHAGAFLCGDTGTVLGANSRKELAHLNELARLGVIERLYTLGVDIPCTDGVMIGPDVEIGRDTVIMPGSVIMGRTKIGEGCTIGPNTQISDSIIGDGAVIDSSKIEESRVGAGCRIGPFAHLRPDCDVGESVKIGNFVEVKNSTVGARTSFAHLTYIGDSDFGQGINVGCGVVTVNYDGQNKFRTAVGDGAFIGCNTNLIAPVSVGEGAYIAAATTVTEDVSPNALVLGRVRQSEKPNGAAGRIKKR